LDLRAHTLQILPHRVNRLSTGRYTLSGEFTIRRLESQLVISDGIHDLQQVEWAQLQRTNVAI